ncbi:MAG: four helix bundle protein [Schleiferiaceae bacterium]
MKTHRDLIIWRKSIEFATKIYKVARNFPKDEVYGLNSQLKRSAVSIPSNIAEGAARDTKKDFIRFLSIATSSAVELETQLIICKNVDLLGSKTYSELNAELLSILKLLHGLKRGVMNN